MITYKELKRQHLLKEITEEEYQKKKDEYLKRIIHLYFRDMITKEEFDNLIKE